ncbi:MAG: ABC transporter ATP-binding protein [Phyllobacteriaceae bacterium]|nr:ABC transporter ATP-binding protein [Phyllobacteriaceae bacterium]
MASVKLSGVRKAYGEMEILHGIDLDIKKGEFVVFVGPSGCGKSTLLRAIAGLEQVTGGTIEIDGIVSNDIPPSKRGIAMVFQSYALYPHMTVRDNMAFGLRMSRSPKEEIDRRIAKAADILQLTPYLHRLPKALSGGQRQRVAIGRAICRDPKVFLFDEPLSNLDAALRVATRIEIAKLNESMPDTTMIYVTHDQVEAMTLADRIVVLRGGNVEQVGTPMELYHKPANLFVAQFIGSPAMNIVPVEGSVANGVASVAPKGGRALSAKTESGMERLAGPLSLGVRPENIDLVDEAKALFSGTVTYAEQLGEVEILYVDIGAGEQPIVVKIPGYHAIERGRGVHLAPQKGAIHLFDAKGNAVEHQIL